MLRRPVVAALAALAALVPVARAHTFTEHFEGLEEELAHRRDNDFGGTLDKSAKKQQKAVVKSLALLEKEADDLGDDLRTAGKASGLLEKAFPEEFTTSAVENLSSLLSDLGSSLSSDVDAAIDDLEARIPSLSAKGQVKVQKSVDAARAAWNARGEVFPGKTYYKALGKAQKAAAKGGKAADRDGGGGGGGTTTLMMAIADFAFTGGPETKAEIFGSTDTLAISSSAPGSGGTWYLFIWIPGVDATGTFPLDGAGVQAFVNWVPDTGPNVQYDAQSGGTLQLTTFDPPNRIAGTFSFPANNAGAGPTVVSGGTFDIAAIEVYP